MVGFSGDDRGVSEVLGAVLVFGLVLAVLALVQMQAVPAANEEVEANHNEEVRQDFVRLEESISRIAQTGTGGTVEIDLGMRYPSRLLFVNPPPAVGSVRTTQSANVTLANATAIGGSNSYLDGSTHNLSTRSLRYEPGYHEYRGAGALVIEPGVRYKRFDGANVADTASLVEGRSVTLLTIEGNLSESGVDARSLKLRALSAPSQTISLNATSAPLKLTLPTQLNVSDWREALRDERVANGGNVRSISENGSRVDVVLQQGESYNLRMARIGVGDARQTEPGHYLASVKGDGVNLQQSGSQQLVVQARDQFNNPVSGVEVTFNTSNGLVNGGSKVNVTTDSSGRAVATYTGVSPGPDVVTAVSDLDNNSAINPPLERTNFTVTVRSAGIINPPGPVIISGASIGVPSLGCPVQCVDVTFQNVGDQQERIDQARVSFYSKDCATACATPDEVTIESGNPSMEIGGNFTDVTLQPLEPRGDPGDTQTYTFEFTSSDPTFKVEEGDFFVVTFVFDSGNSATYFAAPQN